MIPIRDESSEVDEELLDIYSSLVIKELSKKYNTEEICIFLEDLNIAIDKAKKVIGRKENNNARCF